MGIRIETRKDGHTKFWELSDAALDDQGLLEDEMRDLNEYLERCDIGIDSGGSFKSQTFQAVLDVLENGKRVSLVLADSDHYDMTIDVVPL